MHRPPRFPRRGGFFCGDIGAKVDDLGRSGEALARLFFGEDQARYVVTVAAAPDSAAIAALRERAASAGVALPTIGATGGEELKLGRARAIPVSELQAAHEGWFPAFMAG